MPGDGPELEVEFSGDIWYWRGPSPFHFVTVPAEPSEVIKAMSSAVTYGWGMIPVRGRIGETEFTTSLWPKDGGYVVPIKDAVRRPERLELGDEVTVRLTVDV
jgi:hypothetical protein